MRKLTYKTRVWLYVTQFTVVILTISFSILAGTYYFLSLGSFKKELVRVTRQIVDNHLLFENDQIMFKKDGENRTVSAMLRDENMSAIFFDANLDSFAVYGIYQKMESENVLDSKLDVDGIKKSFENNKPEFNDVHFYEDKEYFSLDTPILYDNNKVGIVQLSTTTSFFSLVKKIGLYVLGMVIVFSLVVSWPISHLLVDYLLKPLNNLVKLMDKTKLNNLNTPLRYTGHKDDALSTLVDSYNKMLSRLADSFDRQKDFVSQASHELKTPLARVISTLDVATIDNQIPEVEVAKNDLFAFSDLIDELLILSKADSGNFELKEIDINIYNLIAEISDNLESEVKIVGDKNLEIKSDRTSVKLIISNLLSNAIKYSPKEAVVNVVFDKLIDNKVVLYVVDQGIGMSKDDQSKIFDRFYRSPTAVKQNGFGIGMALVKQLCQINNLEIELESEIGKGTKVKVSGFKTASHRG